MNNADIYSYFTAPRRKIGITMRILAGVLATAFLVVFATMLTTLIKAPALEFGFFWKLGWALLFLAAFWPTSYVAIRGAAPKAWHPYA